MKRWVLKALMVSGPLFQGCSVGLQPPLTSRGLPAEDRYAFATQNGYDISLKVRDAFLSGCVIEGMRKEFVFQLYGPPDRNSEIGEGWEWFDHKGKMITGILFRGDIVDSVYGDRNGGARSGHGCP